MTFYAIFGMLLIGIGIYFLSLEVWQRCRCSKTCRATIINTYSRVEYVGRSPVYYYYPVYEYEVNGRKYHGSPKQCSKIENWFQVGDSATIHYNPSNPADMTVKPFMGEIIFGAAFTIAGIIMMVIYFTR